MTADQREGLPIGYIWQDLPGINARIPMPESWYGMAIIAPSTKEITVIGTHMFQLSRESIVQKGMFTTGVGLYAFTEYSSSMKGTPVEFARGALRAWPMLSPVSEIAEIEDESFVICRRRFILPSEQWMTAPSFHGELVTKRMTPSHFYYMAAGNRDRDTAYLAWFETPSVKWKEDKPIAETMINNIVLDEQV